MSSRPTIAYLTSAYARAGDTFIRREVAELRRIGFQVHTFSIRRESAQAVSEAILSEQSTTDYILERGPLTLLIALMSEFVRSPVRMWRAFRRASRIRIPGVKGFAWNLVYMMEASYLAIQLRKLRVAHLHNHIAENSATVAMIASELSKTPYSLTVHGPREFFMVSQIGLAEKIASSTFVACISSYTKSQCMAWTRNVDWPKLKLVRCGLDDHFQSAVSPAVSAVDRFIHIGRLCSDKGQLLLIEAAAQLKDFGLSFHLEIIGDGPLRPQIEVLIKDYRLQEHVTLRGWLGSEEVRDSLKRASIMLLPSFAEGLPVVIMEALAMERPVISTYIAGIPELVRPGENGWLIPAGDVDSLVAAMQDAIHTPVDQLRNMGRAGRARVLEKHNIHVEVAKLAALFED